MNNVVLIGRLTKDPETRYTSGSQMAVCTFTLAIDRVVKKGEEKKTDYPRITVFGKQAESCQSFLKKGRLTGVQGRLQTGSYTNRDGVTVYTTDVIADRVEFLERAETTPVQQEVPQYTPAPQYVPPQYTPQYAPQTPQYVPPQFTAEQTYEPIPPDYTQIEADIPF